MAQVTSKLPDDSREEINVTVDDPNLDFQTAHDVAKGKARNRCNDPMLLSWMNGKTGEYYPKVDCGRRDKPAWIVFAESRGGNLVINVNDGEYIFIYLKLKT